MFIASFLHSHSKIYIISYQTSSYIPLLAMTAVLPGTDQQKQANKVEHQGKSTFILSFIQDGVFGIIVRTPPSSSLGAGPRRVKLARQGLVIPQQLRDPPPGVVRRVLTEVGGTQRRLLRVLQLEKTLKHQSKLKWNTYTSGWLTMR